MTDRQSREPEYIVVPDRKPKVVPRYYYEDDDLDDDNESQIVTTRRVVRTKPTKEPQIKYVAVNNVESDHQRQRIVESGDNRIKIRNASNGDQLVLDEDDNIIKIIRNTPTPPPFIETRPAKVRSMENRTVYYETSDGQLVARQVKNHDLVKKKIEYVYSDDEPTKALRRLVIDPRVSDPEIIYEKDKPKRRRQQKIVIRRRTNEIPVDSDDEYEQQREQSEYVQVVQRRVVPTQVVAKKESPTKYVMIRKKVDAEPIYEAASNIPTVKSNRRIVYKSPTKKPTTKYVLSTDGKY